MVFCRSGRILWVAVHLSFEPLANANGSSKVQKWTEEPPASSPKLLRGKRENSRQRHELFARRRLPDGFAIRFCFRQLRGHGKLQHGSALARHKPCKKDDTPRWELERIVMLVGAIWVDSPETCRVFPHLLGREETQRVIALDVAVEYKLRSRREADRQLWVSYLCKSARDGIAEDGRHQLVANLSGTAFHML
jgi:hypothetical protein